MLRPTADIPGRWRLCRLGYDKLLHMVRGERTEAGPMAITTEVTPNLSLPEPPFLMCVPAALRIRGSSSLFGVRHHLCRPYYDRTSGPGSLRHQACGRSRGTHLGWIRNSIAMKLLTPELARRPFVDTVCPAFASDANTWWKGYVLRPPVRLAPWQRSDGMVWARQEIQAVAASAWRALDHGGAGGGERDGRSVLYLYRLDGRLCCNT